MNDYHFGRSVPSQVLLGVGVIVLGVLFLVDNLGFLEIRNVLRFWPAVFIMFGIIKMYDSRNSSGLMTGAILVGVGLFMVLSRMGFWYFSWNTLWPLLLIAGGAGLLLKSSESRRRVHGSTDATGATATPGAAGPTLSKDGPADGLIDVTAILGGFDRPIRTDNFRGGEATAIMGGCQLDLRDAKMAGSEATINVFALMGGIEIRVPTEWTVVTAGTAILGGMDSRRTLQADGTKKLIVRGYAVMGGVEVRN
ncbi:hypothetical protein E4L96_02920 [Massilia arenosa]|uniref:LiaF transmembrane domain-containing protein n=1 Tax=Zemynaea arenosa TaxID=2561931 RepID=A0A4Y9SN69_9BURK|nr:DUF5668 domain-containing protein [Massilia arenosa]TFW28085.1 hypothetical protein E4L96_02920 [Massilia arenosa]